MKIAILGNAAKVHTNRWAYWLLAQGNDVRVFSDEPQPENFYYPKDCVVNPKWGFVQKTLKFRLSRDPLNNNRHKWRVYKPLLDEWCPDIVHAHEALSYGPTLAHLSAYIRVLTPWGPDMELLAANPSSDAAKLVLEGAKAADIITTNAPGLEDHWAKLTGIPRERFELFSWGINTSTMKPQAEEQKLMIRQHLGLGPAEPIVLSPRLAKANYRIEAIIDGWWAARKNAAPDTRLADGRLVILRAGADDASWKKVLDKIAYGDARSVYTIDELLNIHEMASLYNAASATIMIPETDLLAMSLLEALACGSLPIVADLPCYRSAATRIEATREGMQRALFVQEPNAGGVAESLCRWSSLSESELAAIGAENSRLTREFHDWEKCAPRMLEIYEKLLRPEK